VRGARDYNLELRWDGVGSLHRGLQVIAEQAVRTPKGQWVRVLGGWSPHQFAEKRMHGDGQDRGRHAARIVREPVVA
jgi:hypothetical protein